MNIKKRAYRKSLEVEKSRIRINMESGSTYMREKN